jgi:parallel beta-helix repeat protein
MQWFRGPVRFEMKLSVRVITFFAFMLLFLSLASGKALSEEPFMPGELDGVGTSFEITDSEYLNVSLASTEEVHVTIQSVPEVITVYIESASGAASAVVTLGGLAPGATYHKYEDDFHNHMSFTADSVGSYTWTQDLSAPHLIFIQTNPSTKFIRVYDDGTSPDCTSIGIWDAITRTCTLTMDVSETIQIDSDNITLDGNGVSSTWADRGTVAVYLPSGRTNVTVKNLNIYNWDYGIYLYNASYNTLSNNRVETNSAGIYVRYSSNNNELVSNSVNLHGSGIILSYSSGNTLMNNTFNSNTNFGITLNYSGDNNLTGNSVNNSVEGIYLSYHSNGNTITGSLLNQNRTGIDVTDYCENNTIAENVIVGSVFYGLSLRGASNNKAYNNNFISNNVQAYVQAGSGNVFYLDAPVGGNYWDDYDTPAEGCDDANADSFCDAPYVFTGGVDELPWTTKVASVNMPPTANAGPDQSEHPGTPVNLDGSGSSDPDEDYPLTYSWDIVSKPPYSTAELSDRTAVNPSFIPDILGDYTVELVVTDSQGLSSSPDTALISTYNTPPVADAGPDQAVLVPDTVVELDGTQSYDLDGDEIYYYWELTTSPEGSSASLSEPYSPTPTFVADVHGDYEITLLVKDTWAQTSDAVIVSFNNVAPVANAGGNQSVIIGDTVVLDGSGSSDANEDPITYSWSFVSKPVGSVADFTDPTSQVTEFTADVAGNYVVSLTVNDGLVDSAPSNITVTATTRQDAVIDTLGDITYTVNNLIDPSVLKNANLANVLTNKVNAALQLIDEGDYQQALDKLENDILNKTNGCANIGEPDNNDWIEDCDAQAQVYNLVVEAIDLLQGLL